MSSMLGPSALRSKFRNAPRPEWKVADSFRQWLRGRPCACEGRNPKCGGPIRSAHVDHAGDKGMGTKVADRHCIPLSDQCHKTQHAIGWRSFQTIYLKGRDAVAMAAEYWKAWPGRVAYERQAHGR